MEGCCAQSFCLPVGSAGSNASAPIRDDAARYIAAPTSRSEIRSIIRLCSTPPRIMWIAPSETTYIAIISFINVVTVSMQNAASFSGSRSYAYANSSSTSAGKI